MALKITIIILLFGLTIIAENVNGTDPVLLNLTLTSPHADFTSPDNLFRESKSLIYFRNATLFLNNSSVDLSTGYIKSKNTTINSEMAALLSENAMTNLSNVTVEMQNSTLNLLNAELKSDQSKLETLNTNLFLNNPKVRVPNGTLAIITQASTEQSLIEQMNKSDTDPVRLNLTLTIPHADLSLTNDLSKENKISIYFRNATLYLNNSSVDSMRYINSTNTTIKSEMTTLLSKNAITNLSNVTVEMQNTTLNLLNAELKSDQSKLKIINTNFSIKDATFNVPNGTLAVTGQASTDQNNLMEKANASVAIFDENWKKPFFSMINVFAAPLLFVLVIFVVWRLRTYLLSFFGLGKNELVFDKIINSSGDETLDKRLDGISQFAREELIDNLISIQKKIKIHAEEQGPALYLREFMPLPNETPRKSLSDILASISDVIPEIWKPLLPLISILFPSRGIRVSCILQREGDKAGRLGITIKVSDMEDKLEPRIHTIWETENISAKTLATNSAPQTKLEQAKSLHKIGLFLEDMHLFSDAMKYHKEALGILDSWEPPKTNLVSCAKKLVELEIAKTHYSAGESYRKEKDTDNALRSYLLALALEDKNKGKYAWKAIIENSDSSAHYRNLADLYKKVGLFEEAAKLYKDAMERGDKDACMDLKKFNIMRVELLLNCAGALQRLKRFKEAKNYYESAIKIDPNNQIAKSEIEKIDLELAKNTSLPERYIKLLKPASIWVATEIQRMDLLQNIPLRFKLDDNYRSCIYNFFGALYLYHALKSGPDYYEFSKDDLEMAKKLSPSWHLPYENLGLWFMLKGHVGTDDRERLLQLDAIRCYEEALAIVKSIPLMRYVLLAEAGKCNCSYGLEDSKMLQDRIKIENSISCYLSGDNSLMEEAYKNISEIVHPIKDPDDNNWIEKINEWRSARSLYNLAWWYEMTKAGCKKDSKNRPEFNPVYAEKRAKICLAYSLARDKDRNLWNSVSIDKDLKSIDAKEIERLKFEILKELNKKSEHIYSNAKDFQESMNHILQEMKWTYPSEEQK